MRRTSALRRFTTSGGIPAGPESENGSGTFSATLTHYRANLWLVGCVIYSASVSGSVSLTF